MNYSFVDVKCKLCIFCFLFWLWVVVFGNNKEPLTLPTSTGAAVSQHQQAIKDNVL